jgi:Zn-dependent protease with chaperone function
MRLSVSRLAIFLTVLGTASALLHGYAWLRVVADPAWPAPWSTLLGGLALLLAVGMPLAMIGMRVLPERLSVPLAWAAYLWLGTLFYLDVTSSRTWRTRAPSRRGSVTTRRAHARWHRSRWPPRWGS